MIVSIVVIHLLPIRLHWSYMRALSHGRCLKPTPNTVFLTYFHTTYVSFNPLLHLYSASLPATCGWRSSHYYYYHTTTTTIILILLILLILLSYSHTHIQCLTSSNLWVAVIARFGLFPLIICSVKVCHIIISVVSVYMQYNCVYYCDTRFGLFPLIICSVKVAV
jgi:hypothetical protein